MEINMSILGEIGDTIRMYAGLSWGEQRIIDATERGDLNEVKRLMETSSLFRDKTEIEISDECGYLESSALCVAIERGYKKLEGYLRTCKNMEYSALKNAVRREDMELIQRIFNGRDINTVWTEEGHTILHVAAKIGTLEIVKELIDNGADAHMKVWSPELQRSLKPSDLTWDDDVKDVLKRFEKRKPRSVQSFSSVTPAANTNSASVAVSDDMRHQLQAELDKMTPNQLEKELISNEKLVERLMIAIMLAEAFKVFPYDKSVDLYEKLSPKMDDKNRPLVETVIRNQR